MFNSTNYSGTIYPTQQTNTTSAIIQTAHQNSTKLGATGGFLQVPAFMGQIVEDQIKIAIVNTLYKQGKLSDNEISVIMHNNSKPDFIDSDYIYGSGNPFLKPLEILQWNDYAYVSKHGIIETNFTITPSKENIVSTADTYSSAYSTVKDVPAYYGGCYVLFTTNKDPELKQKIINTLNTYCQGTIVLSDGTQIDLRAFAIMNFEPESDCNPNLTNHNPDGTKDYGLGQINSGDISSYPTVGSCFGKTTDYKNVCKNTCATCEYIRLMFKHMQKYCQGSINGNTYTFNCDLDRFLYLANVAYNAGFGSLKDPELYYKNSSTPSPRLKRLTRAYEEFKNFNFDVYSNPYSSAIST